MKRTLIEMSESADHYSLGILDQLNSPSEDEFDILHEKFFNDSLGDVFSPTLNADAAIASSNSTSGKTLEEAPSKPPSTTSAPDSTTIFSPPKQPAAKFTEKLTEQPMVCYNTQSMQIGNINAFQYWEKPQRRPRKDIFRITCVHSARCVHKKSMSKNQTPTVPQMQENYYRSLMMAIPYYFPYYYYQIPYFLQQKRRTFYYRGKRSYFAITKT